jgi:hypothetical protein
MTLRDAEVIGGITAGFLTLAAVLAFLYDVAYGVVWNAARFVP